MNVNKGFQARGKHHVFRSNLSQMRTHQSSRRKILRDVRHSASHCTSAVGCACSTSTVRAAPHVTAITAAFRRATTAAASCARRTSRRATQSFDTAPLSCHCFCCRDWSIVVRRVVYSLWLKFAIWRRVANNCRKCWSVSHRISRAFHCNKFVN